MQFLFTFFRFLFSTIFLLFLLLLVMIGVWTTWGTGWWRGARRGGWRRWTWTRAWWGVGIGVWTVVGFLFFFGRPESNKKAQFKRRQLWQKFPRGNILLTTKTFLSVKIQISQSQFPKLFNFLLEFSRQKIFPFFIVFPLGHKSQLNTYNNAAVQSILSYRYRVSKEVWYRKSFFSSEILLQSD